VSANIDRVCFGNTSMGLVVADVVNAVVVLNIVCSRDSLNAGSAGNSESATGCFDNHRAPTAFQQHDVLWGPWFLP
jgi:hypothetical protein